ncbi:Hypothetical Protein SLY_1055 [Strawberry lethal yellows phytoplasma (CPA) str. NZSb11]|uniref:Uncharacterized protein n=1 Tax=Strawberry lethal yellows phytoplasma (CPA) str. NZSb11 TaxID=980422 RepID=R4RNM6_PHYAS|nr:Hypothetical Protein SLY_1055 [Strawberry lethal yellows phytoplasma (CPA) str. NZSb11]
MFFDFFHQNLKIIFLSFQKKKKTDLKNCFKNLYQLKCFLILQLKNFFRQNLKIIFYSKKIRKNFTDFKF